MTDEKKIVEINGVKLEIDLREAKTIDTYHVGDPVRVLTKKYEAFEAHSGIIVAFDDFKNMPTIVVTYIDASFGKVAIETAYINSATKDTEIAPATDVDALIDRERVVEILSRDAEKKRFELREAEAKIAYFKRWCHSAFGEAPRLSGSETGAG